MIGYNDAHNEDSWAKIWNFLCACKNDNEKIGCFQVKSKIKMGFLNFRAELFQMSKNWHHPN